MNKIFYNYVATMVITFICILLVILIIVPSPNTANTLEIPTLEIYTPNNIYYIDELRVTNENNNIVLYFENTTQLYNYITEITANDTRNCN